MVCKRVGRENDSVLNCTFYSTRLVEYRSHPVKFYVIKFVVVLAFEGNLYFYKIHIAGLLLIGKLFYSN